MDKLRAMNFFCRAVEMKSFAAAAKALDVPPSVVSRVISGLEGELRCTFRQGDEADAVFYIQKGSVKLTVLSRQGKEAVVGIPVYHPCLTD